MHVINFNNPDQKTAADFHHFFNDELGKILWCELIVREMMPFLIKHCQSEELIRMLSIFFLDTERQIAQLEEVFSLLELELEEKECDIMKGMIDSIWLVSCSTRSKVRDAAILMIVQRIIGHQVISYRTLSVYLRRMKKPKAVYIVEETLSEKKNADTKFHNLSIYVNYAAMFSDSYKEGIVKAEN